MLAEDLVYTNSPGMHHIYSSVFKTNKKSASKSFELKLKVLKIKVALDFTIVL
jgi:hypothetical protein